MDALIRTVSASSTNNTILFSGEGGKGLHRVHVYNTDDTNPALVVFKINEGTSNNIYTIQKHSIQPEQDIRWIGIVGSDDQFIIELHNPYESSFVDDDSGGGLTTEDGQPIGDFNNITVNYTWQ